MKTVLLMLCFLLCSSYEATAQTEFTLTPSQSMLMTGKGPGQDATINPYDGKDCYAIVENLGKRSFSVRIQYQGEIIHTVEIPKGQIKRLKLPKGYELYLDPNAKGTVKARVGYEPLG